MHELMLTRTCSREIVTKIIYRIEFPDLVWTAFMIMMGLFIMNVLKNEGSAAKGKHEVQQKEREQVNEQK